MGSRVYIETTIPSYYYEIREDAEDELERGNYPFKSNTLELVRDLPVLEVTEVIEDIVEEYISSHLMPKDPAGDALHLALASYYHCNFLLTWNCQHLANANKFEHIRHVNTLLGLFVPVLTTPYELVYEEG